MLLIGRSYAAAVERRYYRDFTNDEFYFDKVINSIRNCNLDNELVAITGTIDEEMANILALHNMVTKELYSITELYKRSLASKYLHFHYGERIQFIAIKNE
ncbi:hypothetical protein SAMN05421493_10278 [Pseudobutyrivibrio sp. 49]|nr:hypothetical protein SAMN05421493_10278 [Pseudobutyrivibrio sp. 49]